MNQHATAIQWREKGVLLVGPPGCGKSWLAWQLIQAGAKLVADDQVILTRQDNYWIANAPPDIRNKLYLREQGFKEIPAIENAIIEIIFQSDRPAFDLSLPPQINVPVIQIDFTSKNAAWSITHHLRGLTG